MFNCFLLAPLLKILREPHMLRNINTKGFSDDVSDKYFNITVIGL